MNFLLHRHLAEVALGSAVAGIGAMLPDLWRIADRRVRAGHGLPEVTDLADGDPLADVLRGVAHHLAADAWFHRSDVFDRGERAAAAALGGVEPAIPRLRLFAHITWELCLDGALLRSVSAETELAALRVGFDDAARGLDRAAGVHHFDRVPGASARRGAFDARMRHIELELRRGPWVEGYAHGRGVAQRVSGVRAAVGLPALGPEEIARVADALDALTPLADAAVGEILRDPAYSQATSRPANASTSAS